MTPVASPVDPRRRNWTWYLFQLLMQSFSTVMFRYRQRGMEKLPPGGALLIINHQSFIDPLVTAVSFQRPVSYLARHDLFEVPIVGWILRNTYVMPIRRNAAATESIRLAVDRIKQGYYVGIFPEGTRSRDGKLQEMKPGFLAIVRRAQVPIVPVGIAGAGDAFPRGALFVRPRTVRVVIGESISREEVEQLSQRGREQELMLEIRHRVEEAMEEAKAWVRGPSESNADSE